MLAVGACAGLVLAMFKPANPPAIPTPESGQPLSYDPKNIPTLRDLKIFIYAAALLNEDVADKLIDTGVNLAPLYGATEVGGRLDVHLRPQEDRDDIFEFVAVETEALTLCVSNTTVDGKRAYATNDLVQRHPEYQDMHRIYGRVDDQIMLSMGEKTNPGPIEIILTRNPRVKAALMFGRGKLQNGVLIQPEEDYEFDPADVTKLEKFRNAICPSDSLWTAKGTLRGNVSLAQYDKEIDTLYDTVADASQTDIEPPVKWTPDLTIEFVRTVAGCDSLQAIWIRNSLMHAVRVASSVPVSSVPGNFVYANPSIAQLAKFLVRLCGNNTEEADAESVQAEHVQLMEELAAKYTSNLPLRRVSNGNGAMGCLPSANEIVLLT
ncbi:hypothetical protein EWM64_g10876, partial [Hericium alpestre]